MYVLTILQQKEGFSPYVWEDLALDILAKNPKLKANFDALKASDNNFNNNSLLINENRIIP